jgi:alpha-galactosidase
MMPCGDLQLRKPQCAKSLQAATFPLCWWDGMKQSPRGSSMVIASQFTGTPGDDGFPAAESWNHLEATRFASDWQGKNEDALRETAVRVLWTKDIFFMNFWCRYRTLTVFEHGDSDGRRDQLWDRDVAEVFIQTDPSRPRHYLEFEVSPNGMWIDLAISPDGKRDPGSRMKSRVKLDESGKIWNAEIALPMRSITEHFDPSSEWRVNFFRVEGATEPRFYSAWRPTFTPQPNFHVPEAFGKLRFRK